MTPERLTTPQPEWPQYFTPVKGQEHIQSQEVLRVPNSIVDIFHIRRDANSATQTMAVMGCVGGILDVKPESQFGTLPSDLQTQIQAVQASSRNRFRVITASSLDILSLDAVEQTVDTRGFNDAISLFASVQSRISHGPDGTTIQKMGNQGKLTVGRLDLLHSLKMSLMNGYQNPQNPAESMHHLFVPTGSATDIKANNSMALAYPIPPSELFDRAHNEFIVRRLASDTLNALQKDMKTMGVNHWFTQVEIPVPNRKRLEQELEVDGYQIQGNVAVKRTNTQPQQAEGSLLGILRKLHHSWLGHRILIPNQATTEDYLKLIDGVLQDITSAEDQQMIGALNGQVMESSTPITVTPAKPAPIQKPIVQPQPKVETIVSQPPKKVEQPKPVIKPTQTHKPVTRPVSSKKVEKDWSNDFSPITPTKPEVDKTDWWNDFNIDASKHERTITSISDIFVDELETKAVGKVISHPVVSKTKPEWTSDFSPVSDTDSQSNNNWESDFKTSSRPSSDFEELN